MELNFLTKTEIIEKYYFTDKIFEKFKITPTKVYKNHYGSYTQLFDSEKIEDEINTNHQLALALENIKKK